MNKIILGGIVTVLTGLILAATAWNFSAVAEMPEKYMPKDEAIEQHQRIDNKLDRILDHLIRRDR